MITRFWGLVVMVALLVAIVAPARVVAAGGDDARIIELPSAVGHSSIPASTAPVAKGPRGEPVEGPPKRFSRGVAERKEARAFEDALTTPQKEPGVPAPLIAPTLGLSFDGLDSSLSGTLGCRTPTAMSARTTTSRS